MERVLSKLNVFLIGLYKKGKKEKRNVMIQMDSG